MGVPAAMENLRQRRQTQAIRGRQPAPLEIDSLGTQRFVQQREFGAEFHASARLETFEEQYESSLPRFAKPVSARNAVPVEPEWDPLAELTESAGESAQPMTRPRPCRLLGVVAGSTRTEIKAAYRRKVSQWHPDRLAHRGEEVRQLATRQMAAINDAYRLLRDSA